MGLKMDPSDKLFAGVVLIVVGLVGLVYRITGYGMLIGDVRGTYTYYSGGCNQLSLVVTAVFLIVTFLGIYVVYDSIRKNPD